MTQALAFLRQVVGFLSQALLFQPREPPQRHRQHSIGLAFAQVQLHLQAGAGAAGIGRRRDQGDHRLQGVEGGDQARHHLQPVFRPLEGVAGAADDREFAVFEEFLQQLAQAQLQGLAVH